MIVVAIMGVLAALAIQGLDQQKRVASIPTAVAAIKAIGAAEEGYRALNQTYLNVSVTTGDSGWYPVPNMGSGDNKYGVHAPSHADFPNWRRLNPAITPPLRVFSYKVNAGLPSTLPTSVTLATTALTISNTVGNEPWYITQARGDYDGDGTYSVLVGGSFMPDVKTVNEGE